MLTLDIGLYELVTAIFISTAGALVQASVGFGFALVTVPLLTLMDPVFVPGPTLLANLLLAILMSIRERAAIEQGQLSMAAWGLAVGTVIGRFDSHFDAAGALKRTLWIGNSCIRRPECHWSSRFHNTSKSFGSGNYFRCHGNHGGNPQDHRLPFSINGLRGKQCGRRWLSSSLLPMQSPSARYL